MQNKKFGLILALVVFTCCVAVSCSEEPIEDLDLQESRSFSGTMQKPVKIIIPKIAVDATIHSADINEESDVIAPAQAVGVAWYEKYASPGWDCNAILGAHRDFRGTPGAFANLGRLKIGDSVEFHYEDGSIGYFVVKSRNTYSCDNIPASVMANSGPTRTTLITSAGSPLSAVRYSHCLVVTLVAVEHIGLD